MTPENIGEFIGYFSVYLIPTFIGAFRRVVNPLFTITWVSNLLSAAGMFWLPKEHIYLRALCVAVWILSFGLAFNQNRRSKANKTTG